MRTAKSSKLILLFITMALCLIACFVCFSGTYGVHGATPDSPKDYFNSSSNVEYKNDGVSATLEKDGELTITSSLALDNLGVEVKTDASIKALNVAIKTAPYYANGNLKEVDGEFELVETVEHNLLITFNGTALSLNFNGESASANLSGNLDLVFKVTDNVLYAYVEGVEVYSNKSEYKVRDIETCIAEDIEFTVSELADGATETELLILSVDQDVTDVSGKYKQTFKLNADGKIEKKATPYGVLSEDFYSADGKVYLKKELAYTLSMRGLSVLGELKNTNLRLVKTDANDQEIWLENIENPKKVLFKEVGVKNINIQTNLTYENRVLRTIEINVYDEDAVTPTYDTTLVGTEAYEAYKLAVQKATKTENSNGEENYVKLGDVYNVPSLEDFVKDNIVSYGNLDATVYYKTPLEESKSSGSLEIEIESAGDYVFYVVFGDSEGNEMEKDDFFTTDENDENNITKGVYGDFIFSFHIEDDSAFDIDASKLLGKGFVGKLYSASDFKINASNYSKSYKLFYNANSSAKAEDEGWVEIISSENIGDDYQNAVFSAEDIEKIGYNGKLSFTPDRVGAYKITCSIVSDSTSRAAEAEAVFTVEEPITVKPYKPLETREIFAIVFLSVGGLCLVGIIALIFVKPKEKTDAE